MASFATSPSFRGDNSPLSVLRQNLFHSYDKAVIPQQVRQLDFPE